MNKLLAYKTIDGTISVCAPAAMADIQNDLTRFGKNAWIKRHEEAGQFEAARGMSRETHDKRLAWVANVADFDNITEAEFMDFIHTSTPGSHQYHHWIHRENLPPVDEFRDAWTDIDAEGVVTHDLAKAKDMALKRTRAHRDALLTKYDGLQARALDLGTADEQEALKAKRQALRDATNALKALTPATIDEVKSAVPDLSGY